MKILTFEKVEFETSAQVTLKSHYLMLLLKEHLIESALENTQDDI